MNFFQRHLVCYTLGESNGPVSLSLLSHAASLFRRGRLAMKGDALTFGTRGTFGGGGVAGAAITAR